jgi:UDP-N-acetylmuramoylalanine--D-glutamate ligase
MTPNDVVVLNGDDEEIARWPKPHGPVIRTFSLTGNREADAIYENGKLLLGPEGNRQYLMERDELPLLGAHNVANALAAALAAASYGIALEPIRNALMAYQALPHRLKPVTTCGDVVWINDSKATNPNAASAALKAMTRPTILLVGGSEKEADFGPLGTLIGQTTKTVIAYGSTRHRLAEAIGTDHSVILVETLDEAVARANTLADPGDAVLLSPACASYDQFRSYAHRGDIFERLVLTATKLHENASK